MTFDLSRIRFNARRDFLGVVMQQGRVQLDSDWNEWVMELLRRVHVGAFDTFNGSVVPRTTPDGFRIEAAGGALTIGVGRIYVDGLLAENHGGAPELWDPHLAELAGTTPLNYTAQPYYPEPPALPTGGTHLVYLDVWRRDVSAVQDPRGLIEQAVGVDTTGRQQTVWQVKVLPNVGAIDCATPDEDIPNWLNETAPSAARLSTGTGTPTFEPDPCELPPAAGYRGLENQLYRVEVHTGGALGDATFKWSRDNATVASRVTHINPARDRITVESIGRDDVLRFHDGDFVEVTDDFRELKNLPGDLRRIRITGGVDDTARTLELETPLSAGLFPTDAQQGTDATRNTRVRRWDQSGIVHREDNTEAQDLSTPGSSGEITIPAAGTRLFLEHGILVDFSLDASINGGEGEFKSGDYWVFAARSADASVELLAEAPPLGIHHHYTRLSVVSFPDAETDCRTLWPPEAGGEGCDCTVCVSAELHNAGTATLQQAIDSIKATGGTICLGVGTYNIREPLSIEGAVSLRIRGQGFATLLVGTEPGSVIAIERSTGVALENFSVIGSGGNAGTTALISARHAVDLRVEHVNVFGLAAGDGTSVGLGLSGYVLGASIRDCAIVAERGVANLESKDQSYLLTGELRVTDNVLLCRQRAVSLDGMSLHFGNTRIDHNLTLLTSQAAFVATGAVLPGSPLGIADNVIYTTGQGIRAGVDGIALERNEITGLGARSGDGIVLEQGLDPVALDRVRIAGNRLLALGGSAITVSHRLEHADICDNVIDGTGQGALIMAEGCAAGYLRFNGNHCKNVGQAAEAGNAFAALQLVRVERGDVLDNVIALVARTALSPRIDALLAAAVGELRIAGNRFYGIGPDISRGPVSALHLLPPFDRVAIDDNTVDRQVDDAHKPGSAVWRAIDMAPGLLGTPGDLHAVSFFNGGNFAFLLTATHLFAAALRMGTASIRGNRLSGALTTVALNRGAALDHCLFADNQCSMAGELISPCLGDFAARTINASNNRLTGPGKAETLHLRPSTDRAIVIGNVSTGELRVVNGVPVPADIHLTNIIGI